MIIGVFKKNFIPAEVLKQGVPPKGLKLMAPGTTLSNVSGPMNPKCESHSDFPSHFLNEGLGDPLLIEI